MSTAVLLLILTAGQFGQSSAGELRLTVTDPSGLPLQSHVLLVSAVNQLTQTFDTDAAGSLVAKRLPFGRYRLDVARDGFATFTTLIDIHSELPLDYHVRLMLTPIATQVTVTAGDTLIDERQSGTASRVGADTLQRRVAALPGRSVSDVINTQPGWLLEANGILHPRGSEYQVQYVVDGLPITDNRSPAFAPEFDADDVHSMNILTAGYPAEYGRKLGGVVEVVTATTAQHGLHGSVTGSLGSFDTATGGGLGQYGWGRNLFGVSGSLTRTDRYLDPPVEENFTNHGTGANLAVHFERDFSDADRFGAIARHGETRFQVPNELLQQEAGQIQGRTTDETAVQISYQHIFSSNIVGDVRGLMRNLGATLSSNEFATPIDAAQDRGLREGYVKGTLTVHAGHNEFKSGVDADFGRIRESFAYEIVDPSQFDPDTPQTFQFADRRNDREQALFVQDRIALGRWTINAGIRWDHYRLLVDQNALSPRLGVAWFWPRGDLVVRAAYDRAFQTPAVENLLLASSPDVDSLNENVVRLPVMPSLGNFFEVGVSKRVLSKARVDVSHFDRHMKNFADDDLLLNTGVSFPIAFDHAAISGTEVKFDLPRWRSVSASLAYSYMVGTGWLPVTGGLLLGADAGDEQTSNDRFPISQDQHHTLRGRMSYDVSPRVWVALSGSYGSGLPVEFEGDEATAVEQYGQRIVDRVDFEQGRVRPSTSLDASIGVLAFTHDRRRIRIQADVLNLTNRLNVINFAGLFSGTALAPPRSVALRAQVEF
jgi:outer membrane cobalamin receptor